MRPIEKGEWPLENGIKVIFANHVDAKPYLEARTGRYCHFCEMPILNSPAVEHIKPKKPKASPNRFVNLRTHWANLMLVCTYCNSTKGSQIIKTGHYYWPQRHNTFLLFSYLSMAAPGLPSIQVASIQFDRSRAQNLLDLYGLQSRIDSGGGMDTRYKFRMEAIDKAIRLLREYSANPKLCTVGTIVDMASSTGFWSIWMEVFVGEPTVRHALLNSQSFGSRAISTIFPPPRYQAVARNPQSVSDPI